MAELPRVREIKLEDIQGAPAWALRLIRILNDFMGPVFRALQGTLTFGENIASDVVVQTFKTRSDYSGGTFDPLLVRHGRARVQGVMLMQILEADDPDAVIQSAVSISWRQLQGGAVSIGYVSGLENSTRYTLRVLVV